MPVAAAVEPEYASAESCGLVQGGGARRDDDQARLEALFGFLHVSRASLKLVKFTRLENGIGFHPRPSFEPCVDRVFVAVSVGEARYS